LGKTTGLGPDPNAARRVLEILAKALDLKLDLAELEKQMMKLRDIENKVGKIEKKLTRALRKDQTRYIG
jgi:proteasome assembly chaperone (PAC2) family protein